MYRLNPDCWGGCIAVPDSILEKHLKLASGTAFKVLLYLLKNPARDPLPTEIAAATGLPESAVLDALLYWKNERVLIDTDDKDSAPAPASEDRPKTAPVGVRLPKAKLPTHGDIARRLEESAQVRFIFSEAENVLGSTFGYDMQAHLLYFHDHYGFPSPVVLMLVQHAKLLGNTSAAQLGKIAEAWAKDGVSTFSDAERQIEMHNRALETYNNLIKTIHFPSAQPSDDQLKKLQHWLYALEYDTPAIALAFERADRDGEKYSFRKVNSLLRQWYDKGWRDAETIARMTAPSSGKKGKPTRSYDLEKMGRSIILDLIENDEDGEEAQ